MDNLSWSTSSILAFLVGGCQFFFGFLLSVVVFRNVHGMFRIMFMLGLHARYEMTLCNEQGGCWICLYQSLIRVVCVTETVPRRLRRVCVSPNRRLTLGLMVDARGFRRRDDPSLTSCTR